MESMRRLARIRRHQLRSKQAQLNGIDDRLQALETRDQEILRGREDARRATTQDPIFGAELDRFEHATEALRVSIAAEINDLVQKRRDIEEELYEQFAGMKTCETIARNRERREREEAERREALERDEMALTQYSRRR